MAFGHVCVSVGVVEVAVQCEHYTSEVLVEKKAHSSGGEARAYAFHLFKYLDFSLRTCNRQALFVQLWPD